MRKTLMAVLLLAALPAFAQPLAEGEVRKIDAAAKKITLKHGPIASIDMPPMTMVFDLKDPSLVRDVKVGDKVRFQAQMIGGSATVTQIQRAK